ncbi:MAG: dihydrolipoamide acetyltransferase family protein [Kyrpidia sp.]|nr:dihydrolipoamide acetyltransferase family protein [Kyrpidia sp.]
MIQIKMPQLGESVTEGMLSRWLKKVGETVHKYEPIAEVITDKVTAELPADTGGILMQCLVREGETVPAGTPVALIEAFETAAAGGAEISSAPAAETAAGAAESSWAAPEAGSGLPHGVAAREAAGNRRRREAGFALSHVGMDSLRGRYSPAVRKLAREYGLRLEQIPGTGAGGRVTRRDVLAWLARPAFGPESAQRTGNPVRTAGGTAPGGPQVSDVSPEEDVEIVEASPIRRAIARHMVESVHAAPHAWTMVEADVTGLVRLRERLKEEFRRREGIPLTYLPFFLKAVADTLREYPILNSTWADNRIIIKKRIHLSVAVASEDALWVPVIRDADRLSVTGLAHAVHDLASKARRGRLRMEDVEGGTFTVNNTGAFGSVLSQPILNGGQAAILSVEAIAKRPVVMPGDMLAVRSMVNLCLSLDHRVLDGWICGRFLQSIKGRLEAYREDIGI